MIPFLNKDKLQFEYKLLFFSVFMVLFGTVHSQELKEYNYKFNDSINGKIRAEIDLSNDSIFNGDFNFFTTFKNTDPFSNKKSFTYQGKYKDNLKAGLWTFSKKSFKAQDQYSEKDYRLIFNTIGEELFLSANFIKGIANDNWYATKRLLRDSEVTETRYTINAVFEDSKMVKTLKADFPKLKVELNFNDEGFANNQWIFDHEWNGNNIKDIITFQDGVYKNRELEIDGKTISIEQLGLDTTIEKPTTFTYDKGMIRVLNLVKFIPDSKDVSGMTFREVNTKTLSHLDTILNVFKNHSGFDIWQGFKGSKELKIGLFKLKKQPLSATEKSQIKEIKNKIYEINQIIDNTVDNTFLEIGKLNYEEVNIQESVLDAYKNYTLSLKPLIEKLGTKEIEYVDYKAILGDWLPKKGFPQNISYQFKEEKISKPYDFPKPIEKSEADINSILQLVNKIYEDVLISDKKTSQIFNNLTKKEALSDQEQEFLDLKKKLISLYNNLDNKASYNAYHKTVSSNFIQLINDQFKAFANLNIDDKEKEIDNYLECYRSLEKAYKNIENFPLKLNRLDELYSLTTFNPYIMADMTERLKSRIYDAFKDYLMPNIIDKLKTAQTCNEVERTLQLFDNTYKRLVALVDEDTKDTEKRLKREKDPQKIMEILGINPS